MWCARRCATISHPRRCRADGGNCPDCGKKHQIFGESHIEEIAAKHNIPVVCKLPINPEIAARCDNGEAESYEGEWLNPMIDFLEKM